MSQPTDNGSQTRAFQITPSEPTGQGQIIMPDQVRNARPGQVRSDQVATQVRPDQIRQARPGQVRPDQIRWVNTGQDQAGQARSGQTRSGGSGQDKSDRASKLGQTN